MRILSSMVTINESVRKTEHQSCTILAFDVSSGIYSTDETKELNDKLVLFSWLILISGSTDPLPTSQEKRNGIVNEIISKQKCFIIHLKLKSIGPDYLLS